MTKVTKIAVIGSRGFTDYPVLRSVLEEYLETIAGPVELVSGGARGADSLAEQYASEHHIPINIIYARWNLHGKEAGFLRNTELVNESDDCIAFWDGQSNGTRDTIKKFRELKGIFPLIIEV